MSATPLSRYRDRSRKLNMGQLLVPLEPRIMFDAAAAVAVEQILAPEPVSAEFMTHAADVTDATPPLANNSFSDNSSSHVTEVMQNDIGTSPKEILFIDTSAPDWQVLAQSARSNVQVYILDPSQDGIQQINQVLAGQTGISAIHLVSHGADGMLLLGNTRVDAATLTQRSGDLSAWSSHFAAGADVLIYGCDIAETQAGQQFVSQFSQLVQADVAASTDATGAQLMGGDWVLEYATGSIEATPFLTSRGIQEYQNVLSTINLAGSSGWTAIMYGAGKDPVGDSQAGAADTDIVGDATHGSLYTAYDDNGTITTADDTLVFRLRIDNPTSSTNFGGVAVVGMDANLDGKIDIFMSVDGRNNGQAINLLDPGTGLNSSPSTTTTSPLPTGWLPNNGVYAFSSGNYAVSAVSATSDSNWSASAMNPATGTNSDIAGEGKTDVFVNWRIPVADLAAVLAKPSPVDRNGVYGPRGSSGIAGYTKDTVVQYVSFTQTQNGPINGDLNGVGANYDKSATFASLGTFTTPMSASNPVPASTSLVITDNVSGIATGATTFTFTFSEGVSGFDINDVTVTGGTKGAFTAVNSTSYTLVVTPTAGTDGGTIDVSVASGAGQSISGALPTASGSAYQAYDTLAPTVSVNTPATALSGTPTLSGTSNLADGSLVTVTVDSDNNAGTTNLVYQVMVSGGVWSLNTAAVAPVSGTMPSGGLTSYTKVTATATDAAGNSTSAVELNRPTVNTLSSNDTTPTVSGSWTNIAGDTLTVTVNGVSYTPAITGNTWSVDVTNVLASGASYEVVATVTRGSGVTDTTTGEVTITTTPVVAIDISGDSAGDPTSNGSANGSSTLPVISGTSSNAGGFVVVRLDPNNDGNLADAVTYSVTTAGGVWTLDTSTATPISGTRPSGGFSGVIGIRATDSTGAVADTQVLTVTTPTIAIGSITSGASTTSLANVNNAGGGATFLNMVEDDSVTISGTATGASTVDLTITDANGHVTTIAGVTVIAGAWSTSGNNLSSLDNGVLTVKATISGTAFNATDTTVTHDKVAPKIYSTTSSEIKKSSPVIYGGSELANTVLTVTFTPLGGSTQIVDVTTDANGNWTTAALLSAPTGNPANAAVSVTPKTPATAIDAAANRAQTISWTQTLSANAATNSIVIGAIAVDDIISTGEISSGVTISGTTTLSGATITLSITDGVAPTTLTAVTTGTNWTATLTNAQIKTLTNGLLTVTASAADGTNGTMYDVALPTLSLASPVLTITDNTAGTATGAVTYTFSFSEGVTGFTPADVVVTNGTAAASFATGVSGDTTYTMVITPTATGAGNMLVSIASATSVGSNTARSNVGASDTQAYATSAVAAAPAVTIDTSTLVSNTTPTITGTTTLAAGAPVVIGIDTDNNGTTDLTYSATVQADGSWSLNLATAIPTSGTLSASGLTPAAKITATATNSYGNTGTAIGLNKPTVTAMTTNDNTPTISGTWTQVAGDTLEVVVNGTTYSVANANLSVAAGTWSLTTSTLADATYSVTATTTRASGGAAAVDPSSSEVTIDTAATADITSHGGAATGLTNSSTPVLSGTVTGMPDGTILTLGLDADNNGSYEVTYNVAVIGGVWSVNTATAIPATGTFPSAGLNGPIPLRITGTDPAGNTGSDTQVLTVDVTSPAIALSFNAKTADTSPVITGTSDLPAGSTITVDIDPNNDGNWADRQTYTTTVQSNGTWSVEATTVLPPGTVGVRATGTDLAGNSTTTLTKSLQIVSTAPSIVVTSPIASIGVDNIANASEDDTLVLAGTAANVSAGSRIAVTITDGSITIADIAIVQADGSWSLASLDLSSMSNGSINVTAEVTDTDGSRYNNATSFTHDKSAVVAIDSISQDTGIVADFITNDSTVAITGSGTANTAVTVLVKDAANVTVATFNVASNASGAWSTAATGALAAGNYTIEATVGVTTVTRALTIVDTTAPTLTASSPVDDATGISVSNNLTLTFSKNIVSGSGVISLYKNDGTLIESFNVNTGSGDAGGSIMFNGASGIALNPFADLLNNTGYYIKIDSGVVIDAVGNSYAGITSNTALNFTTVATGGDATAPTLAGSGFNDNDADDTVIAGDVLTYTVTFSEDMDASSVTAADFSNSGSAGITIGTVTETSPGVFSVQVTTSSAGTLILQVPAGAVLKDAAGNDLDTSSAIVDDTTVTVNAVPDTTAPSIVMVSDKASLKAGESATLIFTLSESSTDFVVGDITVSGGTLSNFSGSGMNYTATFTPATSSTTNGIISVASSKFTDAAGNANTDGSDTNNTVTMTVDSAVPTAPGVALVTDSGTSSSDKITNTAGLTLSGVEIGATVQYSTDGSNWGTAIPTVVAGSNTIYVRQIDVAGNTSAASAAYTYTYDTSAPSAPTVNAQTTSDTTPTLSGTAILGTGETLTVSVSGATFTVVPDGFGNWSLDLATAIPSSGTLSAFTEGVSYAVTATVIDIAGNTTSDSSTGELSISGGAVAVAPVPAPAPAYGLPVVVVPSPPIAFDESSIVPVAPAATLPPLVANDVLDSPMDMGRLKLAVLPEMELYDKGQDSGVRSPNYGTGNSNSSLIEITPSSVEKMFEADTPLVIKGNLFKTNSAELSAGALVILKNVVLYASKYPDVDLDVSGHTDSFGSHRLNQALSEARAKAVKAFLVKSGVASDRIVTEGYNSSRPIAENKTAEGRAQNRRVEIIPMRNAEKPATPSQSPESSAPHAGGLDGTASPPGAAQIPLQPRSMDVPAGRLSFAEQLAKQGRTGAVRDSLVLAQHLQHVGAERASGQLI